MTRQVMMVFYGEARWTEARPEPVGTHGDEPVGAMATSRRRTRPTTTATR